MKKIFLLFTFCCGTFLLFSQNKETIRQVNEVIDAAIKTKDVGLMDDYIARNPLDSINLIASFLVRKAYVLTKIHKEELRDYSRSQANKETGKKIAIIMKLYKQSIDTCAECALKYTVNRVKFLKRIGSEDSETYKSDMVKLKAAGFKKEKRGIDLFIQYARGQNNWIGGGLSFMKFHSPYYQLKQANFATGKKEIIHRQMPVALSFFSFGYNYDWQNRTSDMNFSLFQIEAPLYINLTKIGIIENAKFKKSVLYYRPEIGFGTGNIGLYYGYNVKFKKSNPAEINKHLITLKVSRIVSKNK